MMVFRQTFSSSVFRFLTFFLVVFTLFACSAEPLVLKDDFRSPRNKERPLRKATRLIVLHTTEAHAKSSLNKLCERGEAHYCVTEKGVVYRIVDRDREAFHAGRSMWNGKEECDEYSIGIEVVGYHDKTMPLCQLAALRELLNRLKKSYGIRDEQVVCHSQVAYGAPNTWHKRKHRGRKRCGMLFAMPSVRAKLGLAARPANDPDVKARRLVQADDYLASVLYGGVDTMAAYYGRSRPQLARAVPPPGKNAKPSSGSARSAPKRSAASQAATRSKPPQKPPPIQKPPLVVPAEAAKVEPATPDAAASAEDESGDWLTTIGLKGGYFRKKAKLVIPKAAKPDETVPHAQGDGDDSPSTVLPLPKDLHVGRMGDDVKDLSALAKLPGYTRGGPVSAELSPFRIAGAAWRSPQTYYYSPRGVITTGDKVDEKSVEAGTFVFYRK